MLINRDINISLLIKTINISLSLIFFNNLFLLFCEMTEESNFINKESMLSDYSNYSFENTSIDNSTNDALYLNNIISLNDYKLRYCSLAINSKGDFIAEYSQEEADGIRFFYGLRNNGSYLFKNGSNEETPIKIIYMKDGDKKPIRYESENFFFH